MIATTLRGSRVRFPTGDGNFSLQYRVQTQPRIQWVPGALSLGVKRPGREAHQLPPSSSEFKNAWSYISTSQYVFLAWCLVKHRNNFTFTFYKQKGKKVKMKLSLGCILTENHAMKAYWGVEVQLHPFFDLGNRWRWLMSFTPRPLYPQGKSPWYPLDKRLGGPQSRSGRGGEEKNSQPPPGIES
jgi:hypothetical protein